ncbi:hypothetical protein [Halovulum marinum]|nr:hypothetical protein [Halovulum marinum]
MTRLHSAITTLWDYLNPSEPSALYLIGFLAFALAAFAAGLLIGQI